MGSGRAITRWRATVIHLAAGLLLAAPLAAGVLAAWYPGPLFQGAEGSRVLYLLGGIVVLGAPALTLAVYKPGKRGLGFDLACIGFVQAGVLLFAVHAAYIGRPAYVVFVKDRFEVVSALELEPAQLVQGRYPQFRRPPRNGPLLAAADFPQDPAERQKLVDAALAGRDLQHFPRLWVPFAERRSEVLAQARTIDEVRRTEPAHARVVDEYLVRSGVREGDVRWLLLRARRAWVSVLVDASTAEPVKMLLAERI